MNFYRVTLVHDFQADYQIDGLPEMTIEVAIEAQAGDDEEAVYREIEPLVRQTLAREHRQITNLAIAEQVELVICGRWTDRCYMIEVSHGVSAKRTTRAFQIYGEPANA